MAVKSTSIVYAYKKQTAKGTQATGTFQAIAKRAGGGFNSSGEDADTGTSSGGHKEAATLGTITHAGTLEFDFAASLYDDFLASAYAGSWVDNSAGEDELTVGTSPVYFTWVVYSPHLESSKQYTVYTDCQVSGASFSFPKDGSGIVGLSTDWGVVNRTTPATAPWTALTPAVSATKLKTCNVLSVEIDDVEVPSVIDSIDYSISSENEEVKDVRQCDPVETIRGDASTSGTMVLLHDDDSDQLWRDAAAATQFKLQIGIDTDTVDYRILLPTAANRATGPDYTNDNVTVSVPFGSIASPSIFRTNT